MIELFCFFVACIIVGLLCFLWACLYVSKRSEENVKEDINNNDIDVDFWSK